MTLSQVDSFLLKAESVDLGQQIPGHRSVIGFELCTMRLCLRRCLVIVPNHPLLRGETRQVDKLRQVFSDIRDLR